MYFSVYFNLPSLLDRFQFTLKVGENYPIFVKNNSFIIETTSSNNREAFCMVWHDKQDVLCVHLFILNRMHGRMVLVQN